MSPTAESFGLVVPLYNEQPRFEEFGQQLVDFIARYPSGSELLFVDDGSTDATARLVQELIAKNPGWAVGLLRRPHEGKGGTVAAGLGELHAQVLGFCDLDLSTPLDQLERVLHVAVRADVLAVGSRDLAASRLTRPEGRVREALGRLYNRLLQATVTPGVVDTQCGAKVAAREIWEAILAHCIERGYAWDAETIAVARSLDIPVQEVPIDWRHDERSKVRVVRDGTAMVLATRRIYRNARQVASTARRSRAAEVFDEANAELLMRSDTDHWWFRSKAALVSTAMRRAGGRFGPSGWLVDTGAGSGGVTAMLGWDPNRLAIVEGNEMLVGRAVVRHGLTGIRGDVDELPLADHSVEVMCFLDVLEHLVEPQRALYEAARVLVPGGRVVVNVPAHRWLWSEADEVLGHVRRYTRAELRQQLADTGFRPELLTHVFSWLVGPVLLKRRLTVGSGPELGLDQSSASLDRVAMVLTWVERTLLGRVTSPLGTSILCVAVKPQAWARN